MIGIGIMMIGIGIMIIGIGIGRIALVLMSFRTCEVIIFF